ncbi:alpha-2,8-sialyltransferase 8B-like isoform X1 [Anneissia japonica]|uniref:alpha-2,8-sialyltransferase 8B-like isoform X1 n=2 Tax=Anneissia japonica TaxID=1529436 RepID=UPI00142559C7|nr:alpha-2,8-sialyltransferase 8B-like isoform X1 [Anneissia japonica]XP_033127008.1 alpha-2,8-sialyltransferase 8B-like isoform X1 [Anneissia japonica]
MAISRLLTLNIIRVYLLLLHGGVIMFVVYNLKFGFSHTHVIHSNNINVFQNVTRTPGTVARERNTKHILIPLISQVKNVSNWPSVEAAKNKSLVEKYSTHMKPAAFLKFRNQVHKYKTFNADTSILLHEGEITSHMFEDWKGKKVRPKLSPRLPALGSCAIVGNSGVLLDSKCGREIDEHEFVIRNNMAPTTGFENDVGKKTSLVSVNGALVVRMTNCLKNKTCEPELKKKLEDIEEGAILWYSKVFSPNARQKQYYALSKYIRNNSLPLRIAFPANTLTTTSFWKVKHASSGLMMLSIGATFCRNITLYGFYPFQKSASGRQLSYHYYDNASFKNTHDMIGEHKKLQGLNKAGVLRLITDKCNYT